MTHMGPEESHGVVVHEVIRMTLELTGRLRAHMDRVAAEMDLTPMQARAIFASNDPVPMGALADALHCDASNITGIVDRLEERGLMERVVDPADRRRKNLVLTTAGRGVREDLKDLARARNPMLSLDAPDLEVLHGLLLEILAAEVPPEPHLCDRPGVDAPRTSAR